MLFWLRREARVQQHRVGISLKARTAASLSLWVNTVYGHDEMLMPAWRSSCFSISLLLVLFQSEAAISGIPLWNTSAPNIQTSWYLWQICFWFTNKVTSSPSPGLKQQHTQSPGSLDTGVIRPAVRVEKSRQWVKFSFLCQITNKILHLDINFRWLWGL